MADYDFEESIGYWLTITTQALHRRMSERLAGDGITYRQMQVLAWLKLHGQLSQGVLARKMFVEPPTLVRILDRLEQAGWIERIDDPADRRRRLLRMTELAEPVWERIAERAREIRQAAVEHLPEQDVAELKRLLRCVAGNLSALQPLAEPS